jgi:uncharacterized protein DUF4129
VGTVQLVAGVLCLIAVAGFGWTATRLAAYPAPWSAPWQIGSEGGRWPATNAAIRLMALAAVAAVIAWPYFQGGTPVGGNHAREVISGGVAPVHPGSGDLTWLLIVLAVAGSVAIGLLLAWLLPALRHRQRIAGSQAPVAAEKPILSELTDETLKAMMSDRDPRHAILACYARMERGLANRGNPRNPEETALEYMRRLLERAGAPNAPLQSLTRLFHLAGFSAQPIDESMRETAIRALRAISSGAA